MKQAEQVTLIRRALDLIRRRTTDMAAEPEQRPVDIYTSPARLERERGQLFQRYPIVLTSAALLQRPGDCVTHDGLGVPILLSVDKEGRIRGFLNVCRHRGARLVDGPTGAARSSFTCPFHAWTYGLDGKLLNIPHAHGFAEGHCERTALTPFPVRVQFGMVWTDPGPDLDTFLGPLARELAGWNLSRLRPAYQLAFSPNANWKLLMEVAFEVYHFRRTHPQTVAPWVPDNVALQDDFYPHQRLIVPKNKINACLNRDPAGWDLLSVANVVYLIFPNTILVLREGPTILHTVCPSSLDRTLWHTWASADRLPQTEHELRHTEEDRKSFEATLDEDFRRVSSIQSGLSSGANQVVTFGRFEIGPIQFHRALDDFLAR
ncbi:aromatic ring-hydroxylating oxygenase subunit alpha [Sorangium sp. So ce1000]|uniref:aromatic ring-hydroxylating oxygenase subunit alpha n=1 Tax=Sorangium sp. So ce1000 TaxID=3133325 RepID=UPI003F5EE8D4